MKVLAEPRTPVIFSPKWLNCMVGERGFEPPAPASRKHIPFVHTAVFRAFLQLRCAHSSVFSGLRTLLGSNRTLERCLRISPVALAW